jgi:hypothetical protein
MKIIPFAIAGLAVPGLAFAAAAQIAQPTTVSDLSVMPQAECLQPKHDPQAPPPKVVSTFPANGAVVRPGLLVLRVTFDQPMSCKGFFTAASHLKNPCPADEQRWVLSFDRRTIRTVCRAEPNGHYGVRLSEPPVADQPDATFMSLAGRPLGVYAFTFTASSQASVLTVADSLAEDPEVRPPEPQDVPLKVQELHFKP